MKKNGMPKQGKYYASMMPLTLHSMVSRSSQSGLAEVYTLYPNNVLDLSCDATLGAITHNAGTIHSEQIISEWAYNHEAI